MTLLKILQRLEELVAVLAYTVMFSMIFAEIVLREAFQTTLFGSEEIAIICSVLAGFIGYSLVTSAGTHLRANFLDGLVPAAHEARVMRFADLISFVILAALAILAVSYVVGSYQYGDRIPVLSWKLWPFQTVMVYALGISAIKHLVFYLADARPESALGH